MGARLRQLRRQARLTLAELAYVMGHPPGFASHLSRLEAGRLASPSLALVADFLRACRASFADLLPALAEYTGRPPVRARRIEEQVLAALAPLGGREAAWLLKYDRGRGAELRPDARVRAAGRQARAAAERRLLDAMMNTEVNRLGVEPTASARLVAHDYARMVWKALSRTEPGPKPDGGQQEPEAVPGEARSGRKRGRPRKTRGQRLREARARILQLAPGILPVQALDLVRDNVVRLYEEVRKGEVEEYGSA